jgi:uncharacterized protein with ParB-like and HNH nuclease domain
MSVDIVKTDAHARNISELLKEKKYQIDYFQREYRWQDKNIEELITDLAEKFLSFYDPNHKLTEGKVYGHYFLGPIILSKKNGETFIVDGQQRLTTLTILLIFLNNFQKERLAEKAIKLDDYIFSETWGQKSFNLQIDDRLDVMEALYNNQPYDPTGKPESVQNIVGRYQDIGTMFPDELETEHALPMFINWLLNSVDLVEIVTYSDEDAYTVFETMNDRGLNLNPTDMLKGYLLSNIDDDKQQEQANNLWKKRILELVELSKKLDVKNEDIEACKTWIRAKYAVTIRERKRGSQNQDFEQIGSSFHRWVKDKDKVLGLKESSDFYNFIHNNFEKYTRYYIKMREKSIKYDHEFEHLYYNNFNNFTLQYILALAPVRLEDDEASALKKIRAVTMFADMFVARRMVNYRTLSYSSIMYTMFNLMKEIRDLDLTELTAKLKAYLNDMEETFDAMREFRLHGTNKRHVRYLLSRMTHFIEKETGKDSSFPAYINRSEQKRAKRFEIEHVWADKFEFHEDEFDDEQGFRQQRNQIGGLVLLLRGTNQSLGALSYDKKYPHYLKENHLAASMHTDFYERNPNFKTFVSSNGLNFKPYWQFGKEEMKERQELYIQLAKSIWNPDLLGTVLQD